MKIMRSSPAVRYVRMIDRLRSFDMPQHFNHLSFDTALMIAVVSFYRAALCLSYPSFFSSDQFAAFELDWDALVSLYWLYI